jgi:predicted dehydrogenase
MKNKVLQIGAGSMGTRRMRDLLSRGDIEMILLESREDRRERAKQRFQIECFSSLDEALNWGPDMVVISTPPHIHDPYIEMALQQGLHFFCEADIWTYDHNKIESISAMKKIIAAPSCTFYFLPIMHEIKRIIQEELGCLHAYSMCLSVDAPNWHPEEGIEYYARNRDTSAGREMVPFELIGLDYLFGEPVKTMGTVTQRGDLNSEDTWCLQLVLDNGATGQLCVLAASPQGVRKGWAVGANGFVEFDLQSGVISRRLPALGIEDTRHFDSFNLLESVYSQEINTFVAAVRNEATWPFNYRKSSIMTGTLAAAEKSSVTGCIERIDPAVMPQRVRQQ